MRRVLVLAGDGVGPEVTAQAVRVLRAVAGEAVEVTEGLIGGCAIDAGWRAVADGDDGGGGGGGCGAFGGGRGAAV